MGIDAQGGVNRRDDILRCYRIVVWVGGYPIGRAVNRTWLNAATSQEGCVALRPMVASFGIRACRRCDLAYPWSASEFAHRHDQGLVKQPPIDQVLNQRREGSIKIGIQTFDLLEVFCMCVKRLIFRPRQ